MFLPILVVLCLFFFMLGYKKGQEEAIKERSDKFCSSFISNWDEYKNGGNWSGGEMYQGNFKSPTL